MNSPNCEFLDLLKNKKINISNDLSKQVLFGKLIAVREFDIISKEWTKSDEEKFEKIIKSDKVFKSIFQSQIELSFATHFK